MNVSINELAYNVLELYRANHHDSDALDIRQVYFWINSARAMLLAQRLDRNIFDIDQEEIQAIEGLELEGTDGATDIVNTLNIVPSTIARKGYPGTLTRVSYPFTSSSTDYPFNVNPVQVVTLKRFSRVGNRKFNSGFYYATIGKDKKLYFKTYTPALTSYVTVEGVFQNPIEVMILNGETDPYNADYPINEKVINDLTKIIVNEKFQLILQQLEDKIGEDGRDSTTN